MTNDPLGAPVDALRCRDIRVSFGGVHAIEDVSLVARRGEVLGLIGPNGAGKTTLLNVLSGFQRPDSGAVYADREEITRTSPHARARGGVVRTFQAGRIFKDMTVRNNVLSGALGIGMKRAEAEDLTDELLRNSALGGRVGRYATELPFGDERRLSVVRALAARPRYLLLDEPAAGLNEREADELVELILSIPTKYGCGVVVVEHDMRVIMNVCDRIHVLDHGKTISIGGPEQVRNDPAVIEAYFGGVSMSLDTNERSARNVES